MPVLPRLFLSICIILGSWWFFIADTYADMWKITSVWPAEKTLHTQLAEIWILLNHQDFITAKEKWNILLDKISENEILNLSYEDFLTILNLYSYMEKIDIKSDLIEKRWKRFPYEKNFCWISVRYYGYLNSCKGSGSWTIFNDSIEYGMYLTISGEKTQLIESLIKKLIPKARTLQDKSDLWNLIGHFTNTYPDRTASYVLIQRKLWRDILRMDPAWVNGYLLIMAWYDDSSKVWKKTEQRFHQNYRGDAERKKIIEKFFAK